MRSRAKQGNRRKVRPTEMEKPKEVVAASFRGMRKRAAWDRANQVILAERQMIAAAGLAGRRIEEDTMRGIRAGRIKLAGVPK